MAKERFFHTELAPGIHQISDPRHGPSEDGRSLLPGKATRNSYLVIGNARALLFDLALEAKGLRGYAERLAGLPVITVLSHAHVDHIFHIREEKEIWLGNEDIPLLRKGIFPIQAPVKKNLMIHPLKDGEAIDLGDRVLDVIHIPGHTNGSILLFDRNSGILLSGDTVARRLLYGLHGATPKPEFCDRLEKLKAFPIEGIYSAHDRCPLGTDHIDLMVSVLLETRPIPKTETKVPFLGTIVTAECGDEFGKGYFNVAFKK